MDSERSRKLGLALMINGALLLVAVLIAIAANVIPVSAQSAADYHWEYSSTNVYTGDQVLIYHFTGLDPNADYLWLLQGTNEDASPNGAFVTKRLDGDGVTTIHTITFSASDFDAQDGTAYTGSARILDNFGNILGTHYLLASCFDDTFPWCGAVDWANAGGVNAVDQRVGIGVRFSELPRNVDGYFHPYTDQSAVLTRQGDTTILHYQFDPATLPTTDKYRIGDLDGTLMFEYRLQDLYEYQKSDGRVTLGDTVETRNFVIVSTNGITPDFINQTENATAWSTGDNPHESIYPVGAYDYVRTDAADVIIDDGEAVFLVGNETSKQWELSTGQTHVAEAGIFNVNLFTGNEEIWNDGYNNHDLVDSVLGNIDAADYSFVDRRSDSFTVSGVAANAQLVWSVTPTKQNTSAVSFAERRFDMELDYVILNALPVGTRVEKSLSGLGMDTPLGRTLAMLVVMGVVGVFIASRGVKGFVPFALLFLMVGGAWMAIGMGDALTLVLFSIMALVLVYMMINSNRDSEGF